ncbi:Orotidine 5'-phosphate decarboxylase [subsurface metagenome]
MSERIFSELIRKRWAESKFVCVGLDTDLKNPKFPETAIKDSSEKTIFSFNQAIIDATCETVCAYKPNVAFYDRLGWEGRMALVRTVVYINDRAPGVPVIGDFKRGDIGNTNLGYVDEAFEVFGFDAVTLHPWLGGEALQPFLDREDKGFFILCRTSNPGAGEFQDLYTLTFNPNEQPVGVSDEAFLQRIKQESMQLYQRNARNVVTNWNKNGNCGLVVGATYPEELAAVRKIVGDDIPILLPGIGAQGGEVEPTVKAGKDSKGSAMVINVGRAIIFASSDPNYAEAARQATIRYHEMINQYR